MKTCPFIKCSALFVRPGGKAGAGWIWLAGLAVFFLGSSAYAQDSVKTVVPNGTDGLVLTVPPEDPMVKNLPGNEFDGKYSTFKIGMGLIMDYHAFQYDDVFQKQIDSAGVRLDNTGEVRDFRILGSGKFKTKRTLAWKFAYMYDGDDKTWLIRETGLTIGLPELFGHIFLGRTKEGYSLVKVMNGHSPWNGERQMAIDVIPILADGIKWLGYLPKPRIFWNLGYYNDFLSEGQSFSTFAWQLVARVGIMPIYKQDEQKVLHIAANLRYSAPLNGKITLKSRPEANVAPQIINTGAFAADNATSIGGEAYFSTGRLLLGSEVAVHSFYADNDNYKDHTFYGGDAVITYLLTPTKRPYRTEGSIFGFVPVRKSVFKGGWGEWEAVLRFSTMNLNDNDIKGGSFWRITPMINWYMSRIMRVEFIYGYGVLERYGLTGNINLFQTRFQLTIM